MIEGIVLIVAVFIVGPALYWAIEEVQLLREDRDFYRDFYDECMVGEKAASKTRHPAGRESNTYLRRIK